MQRTLYAVTVEGKGRPSRTPSPITCETTLERHRGQIVWQEKQEPHRTFVLEEKPRRELIFREVQIEKFLW
jgi:hypothetical protein